MSVVLTMASGFAEQKGQTYYWNTKSNKTQWAKPKVRGGGAVCGGGRCGSELDVHLQTDDSDGCSRFLCAQDFTDGAKH
jgi:hypothetical protein